MKSEALWPIYKNIERVLLIKISRQISLDTYLSKAFLHIFLLPSTYLLFSFSALVTKSLPTSLSMKKKYFKDRSYIT